MSKHTMIQASFPMQHRYTRNKYGIQTCTDGSILFQTTSTTKKKQQATYHICTHNHITRISKLGMSCGTIR
eukprot:7962101-Ditylum_brightwellii.AAC.1